MNKKQQEMFEKEADKFDKDFPGICQVQTLNRREGLRELVEKVLKANHVDR